MRSATITSAALLGITAALVTGLAAPEWVRAAGLDIWNLAELERCQRDEDAREVELKADIALGNARREAALDVVRQLGDGRLTLVEAVAEVQVIYAASPVWRESLRIKFPEVATDRERAARCVVAWARDTFDHDPSRLEEFSTRLDAELRAMTSNPLAE